MRGVNYGAAALGSGVVIGDSQIVQIDKKLIDNYKNKGNADAEEGKEQMFSVEAELQPCVSDDSGICQLLFGKPLHTEKLTINIKWEPMPMTSSTDSVPLWQKSKKYMPCDTESLLSTEGMGQVRRLLENAYESDPVGPLSLSSWHPPPVKRVVSIYGINYPTEVAAVYRRNPLKHIPNASNTKSQSSELEPTFVLDRDAMLDKQTSKTHTIKRGVIFESAKSPQTVMTQDGTTSTEFKSGDGSVPYWSLQHCRMWQGQGPAKCDVTLHEIDSVEHRAILNDSRFHQILLDLLGCK
jgi:hypothetical protein